MVAGPGRGGPDDELTSIRSGRIICVARGERKHDSHARGGRRDVERNGQARSSVEHRRLPPARSRQVHCRPRRLRARGPRRARHSVHEDETKVQAVLNEIDGFDHARTTYVGVPAIIMMNFQAANIGEKVGGYADAAGTPTVALAGAFDYVDGAIGRMLAELDAKGLTDSTLVIVTAKHADAPIDLTTR